jgi:hypothetical protein
MYGTGIISCIHSTVLFYCILLYCSVRYTGITWQSCTAILYSVLWCAALYCNALYCTVWCPIALLTAAVQQCTLWRCVCHCCGSTGTDLTASLLLVLSPGQGLSLVDTSKLGLSLVQTSREHFGWSTVVHLPVFPAAPGQVTATWGQSVTHTQSNNQPTNNSLCQTVRLSHCFTVRMPDCQTVRLSRLSDCFTVRLFHCQNARLADSQTVRLSLTDLLAVCLLLPHCVWLSDCLWLITAWHWSLWSVLSVYWSSTGMWYDWYDIPPALHTSLESSQAAPRPPTSPVVARWGATATDWINTLHNTVMDTPHCRARLFIAVSFII